jgi:hypothetical protein
MVPVVMTEVYEDSLGTLGRAVRGFARTHGGETEELAAEARLHFVRACGRYDGRVPFDKYLGYFVRKNLLESARKIARRSARLPRAVVVLEDLPGREPPREFSVAGLAEELSQDAKIILALVFDHQTRGDAARRQGGLMPHNYRKAVQSRLRKLGWAWDRITESFREIREALS